MNIKQKIYFSFSITVLLCLGTGSASLITLNNNRTLSAQVSTVINPSLQSLEDFKSLLFASKMYTTNWVFLRSNQDDKNMLVHIHQVDYPRLKTTLNQLAPKWNNKSMSDSLGKIYLGFEQLLVIERGIMASLKTFDNYDDPVAKLEAERLVEDDLIPRTASLHNTLTGIASKEVSLRDQKNKELEDSFVYLRIFVTALAITIIFLGVFMSLYMNKVIIKPINKIRYIINDLGKGITGKVNYTMTKDEIGEMVLSVNNLSDKLEHTAAFAAEIGNRNFDTFFEPLGPEDTLGKALLAMRNSIKLSDEKLNTAQQIAHVGSIERDLTTGELYLSDEMFTILDLEHGSFDYDFQKIFSLIHPESQEAFKKYRETYMEGREPGDFECRIFTMKGTIKNVIIQSKIIADARGKSVRIVGIIQDITERKGSEEKLEVANRELHILFDSIDEIFFSVNMVTLDVIQISPTCENVFGYQQSEFLNNHRLLNTIIHPDDKYLFENDDAMRRGEKVQKQYRIIRKDNSIRWVEIKITPTLNSVNSLIRVDGVIRDITQRKQSENLLQTYQASLEVNNQKLEQKNKELEQFAYVASHDLQEPLNTTISFVEIFKKQYLGKLDANADKYLTYIIQASDRMRILIKDLLDISRIGHSKDIEKVDCNLVLKNVLADIDKAVKDSGAVIKAEPLPIINGYGTELKQLFQNLIINSMKFRKQDIRPEITITVRRKKDYWHFAFKDNGIGIEPEHSERIFIIFQRLHTRSEYQGSGIGLSHCKKIVELHEGKIWVDSLPGQGSTFNFTIHSPQRILNETKTKLHHAY